MSSLPPLSRWPTDQGILHIHYFIFTSVSVRAYQVNRYLLNIMLNILVAINATKVGLSPYSQSVASRWDERNI